MHFRSILSGTLAVLLVSGAATIAAPGDAPQMPSRRSEPASWHFPQEDGRGAGGAGERPAADPARGAGAGAQRQDRGTELPDPADAGADAEDAGDNEFRLQELEKKAGGGSTTNNVAEKAPGKKEPAATAGSDTAPAENHPAPTQQETTAATGNAESRGQPPREFGTITVDKDGNVVSSTVEPPVDLLPEDGSRRRRRGGRGSAGDERSRGALSQLLPVRPVRGDYANAEAGFRDHLKRFPSDGKAADFHDWLGEALLGQQKYREAAEVFLAGSKQFPKARKAPDMLLKLGVSLVGMNFRKDVACATFGEVTKRYPNVSDALKQRVKQEQALAAC